MSSLRPPWPRRELEQALGPLLPGLRVEVVESIPSTNTELMTRPRQEPSTPVLLIAEHQTAGRGRLGRVWHSEAAERSAAALPSLMFSLGLPLRPCDWSGLSLAVGLAVATSLHADLRLKWPNDIWLGDRKLAGILIETAVAGEARWVVIGIGINLLPRAADGLSTAPAALVELLPDITAPAALARIAPALATTLRRFEAGGFAPFQASFEARDALRGREVVLSDGSAGTARGVDEGGVLLVHTAAGMKRIGSNEVSVRPAPAPAAGGGV